MPKINNDELAGKIKELHKSYDLEFYYTDNLATAKKWLSQIKEKVTNSIAIDIETGGFLFYKYKMLGIGIATSLKKGVYFSVRDWSDSSIKSLLTLIKNLPQKKVYHNMFFDVKFMWGKYGINIMGDYDTLTYSHSLYTDRQYYKEGLGLKDLTVEFLPYGNYEEQLIDYKKDYCKLNKVKVSDFSYDLIPDDILTPYAIMDVICTLQLFNIFEKTVIQYEEGYWKGIRKVIETKHEANKLYIEASVRGLKIDKEKVLEIHSELSSTLDIVSKTILKNNDIKTAEKLIFRDVLNKAQEKRKSLLPLSRCRVLYNKNKFNLNSNQHLAILFYDVLKLKVTRKTKGGSPATDVKVIEEFLNQDIEIMKSINEYNKINKILTSFLNVDNVKNEDKGIWGLVSDEGRIHPNYNINGTVSSRLSGSNPNILQYPSKGMAKIVKKCVVVEDGYKLISFDFKSFEVAILGYLAEEPKIQEMLYNNLDPHSYSAYNIFKDKMNLESTEIKDIIEEIKTKYKDTYRAKCKALNFLLPYGGGAGALSKEIKGTKKEAQDMIDNYFQSNSKVNDYMNYQKNFAHKNGYVENYFNARLYLRNVKNYNPFKIQIKKNWLAIPEYRVTSNWTIQSFNSFYLYERLIKFFKFVKEKKIDIQLMFTIYDSLMLRVNEDISDDYIVELLKEYFEEVWNGVPFGIDVSRTPDGKYDWYSYEELELYTTNNKELIDKNRLTGSI